MNDARILSNIISYRRMYCQHCERSTTVARLKPNISMRLKQLFNYINNPPFILDLLDRKYYNAICLTCHQSPLQRSRFIYFFLFWITFSAIGLFGLCAFSFLASDLELNNGQENLVCIIFSGALFALAQIMFFTALYKKLHRPKEDTIVEPYQSGDECIFCKQPLQPHKETLKCQNCNVLVET